MPRAIASMLLDVALGDREIACDLAELEVVGLDLALVAGVARRGEREGLSSRRRWSTTWQRSPRGDVGEQLGGVLRAELSDQRCKLGRRGRCSRLR